MVPARRCETAGAIEGQIYLSAARAVIEMMTFLIAQQCTSTTGRTSTHSVELFTRLRMTGLQCIYSPGIQSKLRGDLYYKEKMRKGTTLNKGCPLV